VRGCQPSGRLIAARSLLRIGLEISRPLGATWTPVQWKKGKNAAAAVLMLACLPAVNLGAWRRRLRGAARGAPGATHSFAPDATQKKSRPACLHATCATCQRQIRPTAAAAQRHSRTHTIADDVHAAAAAD